MVFSVLVLALPAAGPLIQLERDLGEKWIRIFALLS